MKFRIELSEQADKDLRNIFFYIAINLYSPDNAKRQLDRLIKGIASLDEMPERYRRYEEEPWYSRGLRVLPIDNYVVLYIPNIEDRAVEIVSVMYSGRNISEQMDVKEP